MNHQFELFEQLHHQQQPLLLGNAWDVQSALLFEKNGYPAIGTSSAAIAHSLGYEDGENLSFEELLFVVRRILSRVRIPVSVDMERGFGDHVDKIVENIKTLFDLGVVGINIEDSRDGVSGNELVPVNEFVQKLEGINTQLVKSNVQIFINVRTDAFLLNQRNSLEETLLRIRAYADTGANGIFVPFISEEEVIRKITGAGKLPINVLAVPGLPDYEKLAALGVKRISMGSSIFRATFRQFDELVGRIQSQKLISLLF